MARRGREDDKRYLPMAIGCEELHVFRSLATELIARHPQPGHLHLLISPPCAWPATDPKDVWCASSPSPRNKNVEDKRAYTT